jgi:protein-S-isoprenylcysteine O-methyltransferase Ste14
MALAHPALQTGRIKEVPVKLRLFSLIAVFAAFTIYTTLVVLDQGYFGFLELAMTGGWAAQVFIDLCIALLLFAIWMVPDAREHGIPAWPYFLAVLTTGSVGALAYLVHRTLKEQSVAPRQAHSPATN